MTQNARQPLLLHTKLLIPRFPPSHVLRPELVDSLKSDLEQRIIILNAPPGYGKTTLAAQTAAAKGCPVVWYQLDADDNDPATFMAYLIEGLYRNLPGVGSKIQQLFINTGPHPPERSLIILLNELLEQPSQEWVLVLDDYHLIQNPAVHNLTATLFEHQPPGMKMIVLTRIQPPLPLARWRARGRLTEIRAQQLRFTPEEVQRWTAGSGFQLTIPLVNELVERTEGWGAGLQLVLTLLSESQTNPQELIASLHGSHPYFFNYLMAEIFERQPAAIQAFLLQSSVLNQINAEICREVFQSADAPQILVALERDNLFLVRLDNDWYRYHTLFREFLLDRLTRQDSEQPRKLYHAAAHYYEMRQQYEAATQSYLLANEFTQAASALSHFAVQAFNQGRYEVLSRILSQLQPHSLNDYPELLLLYGRVQRQLGHINPAIGIFEQVRSLPGQDDVAVRALIELASIARSQGDYLHAQQLAAEAVHHCLPTAGETRAFALMELAKCTGFLEGMDKGRHLAEEAVRTLRQARLMTVGNEHAQLLRSLAQICWWHGDVGQAVAHCEAALRCLEDDQSPLTAHILLTLAGPMMYRHEYTIARDYAERALQIVQRLQVRELLSTAYTVLGNILTRQGQLQQAENSLQQAIDLAAELGAASYDEVMAAGYLAYNLMVQGRTEEARQVAETSLYPHQGQAMVYEIYVCKSVLADTYLAAGRLADAETIFNSLVAEGVTRQYRIPLAMVYFGLAYIYQETNRRAEAAKYAEKSLDLLGASETWELYIDQGDRARAVFDIPRLRDHPLVRKVYQVLGEKHNQVVQVISEPRASIRVQTLGSLRVFQSDQEIDPRAWVSVKARDLLAYFITFRHESITVDRIVDALWISDLERAKPAFHTAMYRLRHALRMPNETTKFIAVETGEYRLDLTRFEIDVDQLDEQIRLAAASHNGDRIGHYEKALTLYRGDYLNNLYYDWVFPERQRLDAVFRNTLRSLERLYAESGHLEAALAVARRALECDPLVEAIHCDIMRYLHALGDRTGIRNQYALLEQLLHEELGVEPLPETQRLFTKLGR
jgi:LuxR family maltose regulon positive regulatory protein